MEGLINQKFTTNIKPEICIIIVDNDAEGSAKVICNEFIERYDINLKYDIEKQRGIPIARNHSIDMVEENTDFIAILDDDEVPAEDWLDEFITAQEEFDADILTGPVKAHFVDCSDEWLKSFFGSGNLPNGHNLNKDYNFVYTSNLFAKATLFQHIRFDERFRFTGGSDTHLFMQINNNGYKVVWAARALVTEWLPPSRTNIKWILLRAYRLGNGFAFCELVQHPSPVTRIQRLAKGVFRLTQGLLTGIVSIGRKIQFIRGIQTACLGIGMITGSFGSTYQEYQTIHRV